MKSIVTFPDDYVVIDLETTGFYEWDEIIELGAVRVRNNMIVDRYQQLVKPNCDIPFAVTQLTGISSEMVSDAPSIESAADDFRRFVGNDIVVGHNTNFDIRFFNRCTEGFAEPLKDDYVDTMKLSRKALPELEHHRLCDIASALSVAQPSAHRSIADCETTHLCLQALKELLLEKYNSFEDFKKLFVKKSNNSYAKLDLRSFTAQCDCFDEDCPLYDKNCVFTGKLERFTRSEAAQIVVNMGGHCQNQVTKSTDYLILGNGDFFKETKSTKQKKAEAIQSEGFFLQIINEDMFYQILNEYCTNSDDNT